MNKEETKRYMNDIMRQYGLSRSDIAYQIGSTRQYIGMLAAGERTLTNKMLAKLDKVYPIDGSINSSNIVSLPYYNDDKNFLYLDKRLLNNHNSSDCAIYKILGNSMSPIYDDSDKVIVDLSMKTFIDGHIFLFKYNDNLFTRLINVSPDKIKCIALNKEFDTFYLDSSMETTMVIGLIIPRIRL